MAEGVDGVGCATLWSEDWRDIKGACWWNAYSPHSRICMKLRLGILLRTSAFSVMRFILFNDIALMFLKCVTF